MSGAALGWAKAQIAPSVIAKAVLVCLADYADHEGVAWPSVPVIAAEVQISDRTVQRALRKLEEDGLIEIEAKSRKDGGTTSNRYHLAFTPGDRMSPAPRQAVTPPVTLLSPATDSPVEQTHSDECVAHTREADFEKWWSAYPSAVAKPKARQAYFAAHAQLGPDAAAILMAGLSQSKASDRWKDPTYTKPNPAKWLADERWNDRPATAPPGQPPPPTRTPIDTAARLALLESMN